jgi:uncharacterized RDD family membrane protein YckC
VSHAAQPGRPSPAGSSFGAAGGGGDLVTGEAVVLELRLAKLPSRGVAETLDLLVQLFGLFVISLIVAVGASNTLDGAATVALELTLYIGVFVGYPVLFETLSRGRSLGKMAMGLRVVRDDGGPIRFRHALVRGLLAVFEIYPFGVIAILTSMISSQGKRVGDFLAGTVVVRERVPNLAAPMVMMPPGLAAWASTLELSRLPDDLALSARQFMSRAHDLAPAVRASMGGQIAYDVARFVAPPPPVGCPPEPYLAAVLAERRRRDEMRYAGPPRPTTYVNPPNPQPFAPPLPVTLPVPPGQPAEQAPPDPGFVAPF